MEKMWYLNIKGKEEGPYSVSDIKRHPLVTPDTLAWREGMESWKPIRRIPELKEVFKDKKPPEEEEEKKPKPFTPISAQEDELALDHYKDPNFLILWLLIIVLIGMYVFYMMRQ